MKVAVVGCGAMGSVYAALFASVRHDVHVIDTWAEHMAAIADNGLRVEGASGDRTVAVTTHTNTAEVGPCDLVILATKAGDVTAAAESARSLLNDDTVVLSIQNGLGGPAQAAAVLGDARIGIGVVGGFGASVVGPGHIHHNGMELVRLGEFSGPVSPRIMRVASQWEEAGFKVNTYDDPHQLVWEKLICNAGLSGPCAVTGLTVGELMADEDAWHIATTCATEAWTVAKARDIAIDIDEPLPYFTDFASRIPGARPSMLLDHIAGRRSEIEAINGAIPRMGAEVGVEAPFNSVVAALIRQRERSFG